MIYVFSTAGTRLLEKLEGLSLTEYIDATGNETIGYGHKMLPGDPTRVTLPQAMAMLTSDVAPVVETLNSDLSMAPAVVPTQNQFDALVIFIFDIGIEAWKTSTARKVFMANELYKVPEQMQRWVHGDRGETIPGLVNRETQTIKLYTT